MVKSGVYIIYNTVNDNFYIGSSVKVSMRKNQHLSQLRNKKHGNRYLQRAFNLYGEKSFLFSVLMICDRKDTLYWEQYYMDKYNPHYNISPFAEAPNKGVKQSQETKNKYKNRIPHNKGKSGYLTLEQTANHSKSMKNRNYKHSPEVKKKLSESAKKLNTIQHVQGKVIKKRIEDNLGNIFESIAECSKFHKIHEQTISNFARGVYTHKRRDGKTFKYAA